ncbi:MAG: DUF3426 domain-containing protein [Pseudomonadota bacterium]
MFTQCPECATVFPVSADALSISGGNVRCGACGAVFFAVQSLSDSLDEDGQIPTCFHSDHPPTLSDPGSDAPPIDDLFWPAPPPSREPQGSEHAETPARPPPNEPNPADPTPAAAEPAATDDNPPPLDLSDDEALEREFDRLINEPDTPEDSPQPAAHNDTPGPTPAGDPSGKPGPDSEVAADGEAWVAHRYGPPTEASRPLASSEEADEAPVTEAAPPAPSIEPQESSTDETEKDHAISLSDEVDTLEAIEPIGPKATPQEPDPNEPLPEVFTRAKSPSEDPSDDDDAPTEPPDVAMPLSGVAMELAADRAARNRTRSTWLWGLWSGFALLALGGQWFALEHDRLARDATLRPWVSKACEFLRCQLELPSDLARIQLTSRSIEPHPSVEGALLISATLQNQAEFNQPHPVVEITMADLSGRAVAMRRFTPVEYLENPDPAGMVPGHLLPLVFEVIDPGSSAVAFEFDFR